MKREFIPFLLAAVMFFCSCSEPSVEGPVQDEPEEPVVEAKYKAGEYYKTGLAEGIIAHVDESGEHGLLISMDEGYTQWSTDSC